eukprot:1159530-Pelagomonas_calceolata.AAC.2
MADGKEDVPKKERRARQKLKGWSSRGGLRSSQPWVTKLGSNALKSSPKTLKVLPKCSYELWCVLYNYIFIVPASRREQSQLKDVPSVPRGVVPFNHHQST